MVATRGAGRPAIRLLVGDGAQIVAVEFVKARAPEPELIGGGVRRDLVAAEGGEQFADQGCSETMGELTIMFFMAARMPERSGLGEGDVSALRA